MKYKYYNENEKEITNPIERILISRGIPQTQLSQWLNAENPNDNQVWKSLDQIKEAVVIIQDAINNDWPIDLIVDSDADGFGSSAGFINYIHHFAPEYAESRIKYHLHKGKQHGLEDMMDNITAPIVVIPDGGKVIAQ